MEPFKTVAEVEGKEYGVEYEVVNDAGSPVHCETCGESAHTREIDIREITEGDGGYVETDMNAPENQGLIVDIGEMLGHSEPNCRCWDPEPERVPRK
ncbi:MAG TPA: hypothetical protein VEB60_00840 [Candidatus Paceibacterota bacterium]|nr:hypothetical protein [Candidatus Paceibacterota bacterium]